MFMDSQQPVVSQTLEAAVGAARKRLRAEQRDGGAANKLWSDESREKKQAPARVTGVFTAVLQGGELYPQAAETCRNSKSISCARTDESVRGKAGDGRGEPAGKQVFWDGPVVPALH